MTTSHEYDSFETLRLEIDEEGICVLTIERPAKLNAINRQVLDDLRAAFQRVANDDSIAGVILTGSGDRAFAAGADIDQFSDLTPIAGQRFAQYGQAVFSAIEASGKPVVAAVNGFALGGGCELALACHLRVASENAQFGQPEVNLGLIPGYGGTQRLPRLIGRGMAIEMILTGDRISAQRAYEIGLVNRVATAEGLLGTARTLLRSIITKAPVAVALSLQAINAADLPQARGMEAEAALFGQACSTEDFKEGVTAFLDKRSADFQGR